jgi:hypothetical protein
MIHALQPLEAGVRVCRVQVIRHCRAVSEAVASLRGLGP